MDSYWMGAKRVNQGRNKGGKHMIAERHLECHATKCRIVFLFRTVHDANVKQAMEHFKKCANNDYKCQC